MRKLTPVESKGQYEKGGWTLKNLTCLSSFMKQMGIGPGEVATLIGLKRPAITRWMMVDDTSLSNVRKVFDVYAAEFIILYEIPGIDKEITKIVMDRRNSEDTKEGMPTSRLTFLKVALQQSGISKTELAERLGITRVSVQRWFSMDDLNMKWIHRIAEVMGWRVHAEFRLGDSTWSLE